MSGITFGSCCYLECPNSYSAEADVVFFKFPMDAARRKKWIENIGNSEISQLTDRQLRGKRVCASHFEANAFMNPVSKDALTDKAIPVPSKTQKKSTAGEGSTSGPSVQPESQENNKDKEQDKDKKTEHIPSTISTPTLIVKRGPGRPPKRDSLAPSASTPSTSTATATSKPESSETPTSTGKLTRSKVAQPAPGTPVVSVPEDKEKEKEKTFKVEPILSVEPVLSKPTRGRRSSAQGLDLEPPVLKEITESEPALTLVSDEPDPVVTPKRTTRSSVKDPGTGTSSGSKTEKDILPPILEDQTQPPPIASTSSSNAKKPRVSSSSFPEIKPVSVVKVEPVPVEAKPIENKRKSTSESTDERVAKKVKQETIVTPVFERKTLTPQAQLRIQRTKEEFERKGNKGEKIKPSSLSTDSLKYESKRLAENQSVFEAFCSVIKSRCILPEEWAFSGIMNDPTHPKLKLMSISEFDVGSNGNVLLKRFIQIYDDFTVKVVADGMDVTHRFDAKKVHTDSDVSHLLAKLMAARICQGVRGFTSADLPKYPSTTQRDGFWYSSQCQIIVDKTQSGSGSVCTFCTKLRNTMRKKKVKSQSKKDLDSQICKSKLGTQVFNLFDKLADEEESNRLAINKAKALALLGDRDTSLANFDQSLIIPDDNVDFLGSSKAIKVKLDAGIRSVKPNRPSIKTRRPIKVLGADRPTQHSPFTILPGQGLDNSISASSIPKEIMDYIALQGGNIGDIVIQQNGTEYSLSGSGQEFEIVGETSESHEAGGIQVLEADENSGIQIIEVDDQTLAQLQAQNIGGMFSFQDSSNIHVTEIDTNDPNNAILKVINNPQYYIQQGGT